MSDHCHACLRALCVCQPLDAVSQPISWDDERFDLTLQIDEQYRLDVEAYYSGVEEPDEVEPVLFEAEPTPEAEEPEDVLEPDERFSDEEDQEDYDLTPLQRFERRLRLQKVGVHHASEH